MNILEGITVLIMVALIIFISSANDQLRTDLAQVQTDLEQAQTEVVLYKSLYKETENDNTMLLKLIDNWGIDLKTI